MSATPFLRTMLTASPRPYPKSMAVSVGLATLIPIVALTIAGHAADGLTASLGAFTVLYRPELAPGRQLRMMLVIAAALVASAAFGVVMSQTAAHTIVGLVILAVVSIVLTMGFAVGPPGPMFFVLVYGAAASASGPTAQGGGGADGAAFVGWVAAGSAFSLLLVAVPRFLRERHADRGVAGASATERQRFGFDPVDSDFAIRMLIGVGVAAAVSPFLGRWDAYLVLLTMLAIPVPRTGHSLSLLRSVSRVLGAVLGSGVFLALSIHPPTGILLGVVLGVLQYLSAALIVPNYALALIFVSPLGLLMTTAQPGARPVDATASWILDTLIGAAIAAAVLVIPLPRLTRVAERRRV